MIARAAFQVPDALVDEIVQRVRAELVEDTQPWLDAAGAAEHLCCSVHRIYRLTSQGAIPCVHEGSRLLFRRRDLDAWLERAG